MPALADLVLELEEQAGMRRGTGAEIRVTGDEVVTGRAGDDLDLVGARLPAIGMSLRWDPARRTRPGGASGRVID